MRDLLENIARSIVTDESALFVEENPGTFQTRYTVHAADRDVGRLLGKRGKTIGAIRSLVDRIGDRTGEHYSVWVESCTASAMCVAAK